MPPSRSGSRSGGGRAPPSHGSERRVWSTSRPRNASSTSPGSPGMRLPTEDGRVNPSVPTLGVLQLSDAFERVWATLAEEAGLQLELLAAPVPSHLSRMIVLLAAGGEERAAEQLVRQLEGQPTVVVGADPSRRVAV